MSRCGSKEEPIETMLCLASREGSMYQGNIYIKLNCASMATESVMAFQYPALSLGRHLVELGTHLQQKGIYLVTSAIPPVYWNHIQVRSYQWSFLANVGITSPTSQARSKWWQKQGIIWARSEHRNFLIIRLGRWRT